MEKDTNRGRDLNKGPLLIPQKHERNFQEEEEARRRRLRAKLKKQVTEIEQYHGLHQLDFGINPGFVGTEKADQKRKRAFVEALNMGVPVHADVRRIYGLD